MKLKALLRSMTLALSLNCLHSDSEILLMVSLFFFLAAHLIRRRIWNSNGKTPEGKTEFEIKPTFYFFGREVDDSDLFKTEQEKAEISDLYAKKKKSQVTSAAFNLAGIALLILANPAPSLNAFFFAIPLFYSHLILTTEKEIQLHRPALFSIGAGLVHIFWAAEAPILPHLLWITSLALYFSCPAEFQWNSVTPSEFKSMAYRAGRSVAMISLCFFVFGKLTGAHFWGNRSLLVNSLRTNASSSLTSRNGSGLGGGGSGLGGGGRNDTSLSTQSIAHQLARFEQQLEKKKGDSSKKNSDSNQALDSLPTFKGGGSDSLDQGNSEKGTFPSGLNGTAPQQDQNSPRKLSLYEISKQKEIQSEKDFQIKVKKWKTRLDWFTKKRWTLIGMALMMLVLILFARKSRKELRLPELTPAQKKELLDDFRNLLTGELSPTEEVLRCYYGIEKALHFFSLGRPDPTPPLYHRENLRPRLPLLSKELHQVIKVYYSVLHGQQEPSPAALQTFRKSVKTLLRQFGLN